MQNNILMVNHNNIPCTGCSVCAAVCPQKAIAIKLTKEGFYEPIIDENLCTNCGLCKKSCYKLDDQVLHKNEKDCLFYSAINKDRNEIKTATSGAVSAEIMKLCIREGYKVLGVAYNYEKNIAVTKIASSIDEIEEFKGSKYFQSYTIEAFEEALNDISEQKYVVFGTPCQIYAISKYIELYKKHDKFLLVDIFCHGCPSLNLWSKYLQYIKERFGVLQFDKIAFRSKSYGWHEFSTTFYNGAKKYNSSKINDPFYTMFFDKNVLNKACYSCKLRSTFSYTDIRLGDFWGYQYDTNKEGVSVVVICTDNGKKIFNKISSKFKLREHNFQECIDAQSYGKRHIINENLRQFLLNLLASDKSMKEIIKECKNTYSLKKKIIMKTQNVLKCLPQSLYLAIKKMKHTFLELR